MSEKLQADSAEPTLTARRLLPAQAAEVAGLIRARFGLDLTLYKQATLDRRVARRMDLRHLERVDDYVTLLRADADELASLHRDMMLTVTRFFRDGAPFEALRATFIPRLLAQHRPSRELRVWVPACATGQEAYSVVMCLLEAIAESGGGYTFEVFATDAEEGSIATARRGVYPPSIEEEVSAERLARFFSRLPDGSFQIAAEVRDRVVFSRHDLLLDAPFSRLDLVTCRNVLIYLRPEAQARALRRLHFSLQPHGVLMLGASETVGGAEALFTLVDRENRFYTKRQVLASPWTPRPPEALPVDRQTTLVPGPLAGLSAQLDRVLLEKLAPPAVVVDDRLEVLMFRGKTGPYFEPASGAASFHLLKVTPVDLHAELRRLAVEALDEQRKVVGRATMASDGVKVHVQLSAQPLWLPQAGARLAVIAFEPVPAADGADVSAATPDARCDELERELLGARQYLSDLIAQHQHVTENLRSVNEELQSSVAELQSTNEELQISREELQSTNDELVTVNDVLRAQMTELSKVNDDLRNVMTGVEHGVLVVGPSQELLRFNEAAGQALGLRQADVGRPLKCLDGPLRRPLGEAMRELSPARAPLEVEAELLDGRWHALRMRPYVASDGTVLGAVVALQDIDSVRRARELAEEVSAHVTGSLGMLREPASLVDGGLRVRWANVAWYERFGLTPEETRGAPLAALGSALWAHPVVLACLAEVARSGVPIDGLEVPVDGDGAGRHRVKLGVRPVSAPPGTVLLLVSTGSSS